MPAVLLLLIFSPLFAAGQSDRDIAAWVLRMGGAAKAEGAADYIRNLEELPQGELRMEGLDFTSTLVTPEDLPKISGLTALRELYLPAYMWNEGAGSRRDSNDLLKALAPLAKLEKLQLSLHFLTNINIQDKGMEHLAGLTNLRELRLAQTRITGTSLAPFANLESLDVSYSRFNDEGMKALAGLKSLKRLALKDTLVTDAGLEWIAGLSDLEELDLYGCYVTDEGANHLRGLKRLRKLNLLGAQITDKGLDSLAELENLVELNLYRSRITNAGLEKLTRKAGLRALDVRYTQATRSGVETLRATLSRCRVEFLDSGAAAPAAKAPRPSGTGDSAIAKWAGDLGGRAELEAGRVVGLSLAGTAVTDRSLEHLKAMRSLRRLDLSATEVGDVGLRTLAARCALTELNLSNTTVSDEGLASLRSCGSLKKLMLNNTGVRGQGLENLPPLEWQELAGPRSTTSRCRRSRGSARCAGFACHTWRSPTRARSTCAA